MKKFLISIFLTYLRLAAKIQLFKINPKIVALTGSVGKTSLRQAITVVLKQKFKIKQSIKANSETGIPLDLLDLHPRDYSLGEWLKLAGLVLVQLLTNWRNYEIYIVELGIDDPFPPRNMEYLLRFIHPDMSVFLRVALVHSEQFSKLLPKNKQLSIKEKERFLLNQIAQEKGRILVDLPKNKIGIINYDDKLIWKEAQKSPAKIVGFGKKLKGEGIRIGSVNYQFSKKKQFSAQNISTVFYFFDQNRKYQLKLPLLIPEYYAYTLAAALVVGSQLDIGLEDSCRALEENFVLPPGRMSVFLGIKNSLLIDSSYNASKEPTLGALDLLGKIPIKNKIVALGDMRELGEMAGIEHRQVAKKINKVAKEVVLIGPLTKKYILPIVQSKKSVKWFINSWQAAAYLKRNLKKDSVILIKGSQNMIFMEIVVEALLKNKKDRTKLCRRGKFWEKQRAKLN